MKVGLYICGTPPTEGGGHTHVTELHTALNRVRPTAVMS